LNLTPVISKRDNARHMMLQSDFHAIIESRYPGLIHRIRTLIEESEKKFEGGKQNTESFLWEHSVHTASIASRLAKAEKIDPLLPTIAALFHDAGKFVEGHYHVDATIEEEDSARIAKQLLEEFGMKSSWIQQIISGLKALYRENAKKNRIASIIHDADFLSKFGALGVAAFFTKSALRRRTLQSSLLGYLSKELTYASCLPINMRTTAGRKMAKKKSADSIAFFRSLLAELRDSGIADLKIRSLKIPDPSVRGKCIIAQLVTSSLCSKCQKKWKTSWLIEKGVKCQKLCVEWTCPQCSDRIETSFCLPEL
jgi:putative nucleotidyltransferase with HDIG domain